MANHQHFGGVEKKFVIHRASPQDMRTKRELGGEEGKRMSKSPKAIADLFSANVHLLQIYVPSYKTLVAKRETSRDPIDGNMILADEQ